MQFTKATVRNQILAYLDGVPPHTKSTCFDFTDDAASLRAQMAKMDLLLPELPDTRGHRPADAQPSGISGSAESASARATAEAAFAKVTGAVNEIVQTRSVDLTLPGLEVLGNHLARFPGRKSIVWLGNGMPLYLGGSRPRRGRDYESRMRQIAERLATQGVAVYPIAACKKPDAGECPRSANPLCPTRPAAASRAR